MPKIAVPLTDVLIKNLKPKDKPYKKFDGGGLYINIFPVGSKLWQMEYRYNGKQKILSFGDYPTISIKDARERREDARKLLVNGVDPAEFKKQIKEEAKAEAKKAEEEAQNTFENIAREWHGKQLGKWKSATAKKVLALLVNGLFPSIGNNLIKNVQRLDIIKALSEIEARGRLETAHRTLQVCGQIFRYAINTDRAEKDITVGMVDVLKPVPRKNFASIKKTDEIGHLLRDIDDYNGSFIVKSALRLLPYVFLRSVELRLAKWDEINFIKAEWRVPASRMKMKVEHIVPLARQVIEILKGLKPLTMSSDYLFPSPQSQTRSISDVALLNALRRMGYDKETMTVHGFRSMASTLLNEQGYNRDWIERQLAHGERNKVRDAYNYAQYLDQRRDMMQEYADYLDSLKAENTTKVISIRANGVI